MDGCFLPGVSAALQGLFIVEFLPPLSTLKPRRPPMSTIRVPLHLTGNAQVIIGNAQPTADTTSVSWAVLIAPLPVNSDDDWALVLNEPLHFADGRTCRVLRLYGDKGDGSGLAVPCDVVDNYNAVDVIVMSFSCWQLVTPTACATALQPLLHPAPSLEWDEGGACYYYCCGDHTASSSTTLSPSIVGDMESGTENKGESPSGGGQILVVRQVARSGRGSTWHLEIPTKALLERHRITSEVFDNAYQLLVTCAPRPATYKGTVLRRMRRKGMKNYIPKHSADVFLRLHEPLEGSLPWGLRAHLLPSKKNGGNIKTRPVQLIEGNDKEQARSSLVPHPLAAWRYLGAFFVDEGLLSLNLEWDEAGSVSEGSLPLNTAVKTSTGYLYYSSC